MLIRNRPPIASFYWVELVHDRKIVIFELIEAWYRSAFTGAVEIKILHVEAYYFLRHFGLWPQGRVEIHYLNVEEKLFKRLNWSIGAWFSQGEIESIQPLLPRIGCFNIVQKIDLRDFIFVAFALSIVVARKALLYTVFQVTEARTVRIEIGVAVKLDDEIELQCFIVFVYVASHLTESHLRFAVVTYLISLDARDQCIACCPVSQKTSAVCLDLFLMFGDWL